jgi:hypothetical protein
MCGYEISTKDRDYPEKSENIYISETTVSVGVLSQSISHGRIDSGGSEKNQTKRLETEKSTERKPDHQKAENSASNDKYPDKPFHITDGKSPTVQTIFRSLSVGSISSVQNISQFIGKIG